MRFTLLARWLPGLLSLAVYGLLLTAPAAPALPEVDRAMPEVMIVGCNLDGAGVVWVGALLTNRHAGPRDIRASVRIELTAGHAAAELFAAGVPGGSTVRVAAPAWVGAAGAVTGCVPG